MGLRNIFLLLFSLLPLLGSGCGYKGELTLPGPDVEKVEKKDAG